MPSHLSLLRTSILLSLGLGCTGGKDDTQVEPWTSVPFAVPEAVAPSGSKVCAGAEPIYGRSDLYTGFYRCPDGTAHRVEPGSADPNWDHQSCENTEESRSCETDADCSEGSHGRCVTGSSEPDGASLCGCVYSCATDDDCTDGRICAAAAVGETGLERATCIEARCTDSTSCECGFSSFFDGCGYGLRTACRADEDDCRVDDDCDGDTGYGPHTCSVDYDQEGWQCNAPGCVPGRPLRIDGHSRTADAAARGDWGTAVVVRPVPPATAAVLAAHWSAVAALEHASVASFSRFALQLMALGAPPALLDAAQQAARDEVRHAQLCYGLAAAYVGTAVGPGPLPMGGFSLSVAPAAVLVALIEEGCVNETLAAAEAREAAAHAEDPAVAAVLREIAADEAAHAALAWRTLRWMLQQHPSLVGVADAAFAAAQPVVRGDAPGVPGCGMLSAAARREVAARCWRVVVVDAWERLSSGP